MKIANSIQDALKIKTAVSVSLNVDGTATVYEQGDSVPILPIPEIHSLSVSDFRARFSDKNMMAVLDAAYSGDSICRVLLLKLQTADFVDLASSTVIDGLAYLVTKGIITDAEKTDILKWPI